MNEKNLRIYLDNCCYNRPYDDQSKIRLSLETPSDMVKLRWQLPISLFTKIIEIRTTTIELGSAISLRILRQFLSTLTK